MPKAITIIRYELALLFRSIMFYVSLLMLSIYSIFAGRTDMEYTGFDVFAVGAAYKSYFFIFLALSFVFVSFFFKDQNEGFNEIIGSMPYKSIELGLIRWFCAVAAGLVLCIIHVLIQLIAFKSFYYGFSLQKLTEWFLIGCVPVVLLAASMAFLSAFIFKKQITALVSTVSIWVGLGIWDSTFFPLNNFPLLHLPSPEAKLYETGFSQIAGFTRGLGIVFYCALFCILSSFLMLFAGLGIFKKTREGSRNVILTGMIAVVALCMLFPAVSYQKTYSDIKNSFENKLNALKIHEQEISRNNPRDFKVKSLNLVVRITKNGLKASGKVRFVNQSGHGSNRMLFNLGENFSIESINDKSGKLNFTRKGFIVDAPLKAMIPAGSEAELDLTYSGSVSEWKRTGGTYRDYSAYSFITPGCVYLAQNTGWYPQSHCSPPYKHESKVVEAKNNKKVDTIVPVEITRSFGPGGTEPVKGQSTDTFDIDIRFEGLDGKTAISNPGILTDGIQKYRNTNGMFLYAAKLSRSHSNEMECYLAPGHDRYIGSLQRDFKSREAFFKAFLPSSSIKNTIVEMPFSNSFDIKASPDMPGMSFLNEKILYRLDSKNRYLENEISKAYLLKWLPPTKESLDYLNAGNTITYEEALTDYLVYLYNISTDNDMYSTKISSSQGTSIIEQESYPLASRVGYHISYGKNTGNSKYVEHFENIKLMISRLDNIRKTLGTGKFSEALVKLINIIRERPLEEKDIIGLA